MFKVIFKFVVTKATSTSVEYSEFGAEAFPEVVICVEPALNHTILEMRGYENSWSYFIGRNGTWDSQFIGWDLDGGQINSVEALESLVIVKLNDGGLVSKVLQIERGVYEPSTPNYRFRLMAFPHFRCQVVKATRVQNISGVDLFLNTTNMLGLNDRKEDYYISILLMDPVNSPLLFPESFQMTDPIKVSINDPAIYSYLVKLSQTQHVEGDPHFDCKDYSLFNTYGQCIREELERRFNDILNCTPPWLPSNYICSEEMKLGEKETKILDELFLPYQYKPKL